jgi:hypothetical protein
VFGNASLVGYTSSVDIYLDTNWGAANPGTEFEWDTAVNQKSGAYGQDFIFTAQTGTGGFTIGTGNNTQSSVPSPSVTIDTSGWYRFVENFANDPSTGDAVATLSIVDDATATAVPGASWVIPVVFNGQPALSTAVGGPLLGWFPNENIPELPIDNISVRKGQVGQTRSHPPSDHGQSDDRGRKCLGVASFLSGPAARRIEALEGDG